MGDDYIYKARTPTRIGLSFLNAQAAKALVLPVLGHFLARRRNNKILATQSNPEGIVNAIKPKRVSNTKIAKDPRSLKNQVGIYLIDENVETQNRRSFLHIWFDFIPEKIEVNPTGRFKAIQVLGRNNPHYHYGGGEDSITIEIDWFAFKASPYSVAQKCRMVEALTKADGWVSGPPLIGIQWGSNNPLFEGHMFLVEKAPYEFSQFTKIYKLPGTNNSELEYNLQPMRAKQTLYLKRVTDTQLTHAEIINFSNPHTS